MGKLATGNISTIWQSAAVRAHGQQDDVTAINLALVPAEVFHAHFISRLS